MSTPTSSSKSKKKPKATLPPPEGGKRRRRIRVSADIAHGGSLVVRHMSDRVMLDAFELDGAARAGAEAGQAVWIQLAKPGAFRGHPAGPFELNDKVFGEIVRNFKATANQRIPIDFEHASEADPTEGSIPVEGAPAQGWIVDLKIDGGNLWGLVEWGAKAREYIRAGQYKFFSPAIRFGSRDRVTGLQVGARMTSGALTNNPFLDGMQPLAAKDVPMGWLRGLAAERPNCTLAELVAELDDDGGDDVELDDDDDEDGTEMCDREDAALEALNNQLALSELEKAKRSYP